MELEEYLLAKFAAAMRSWPTELRQDIYALSLYRDDNDVPYRPAVYLCYNTRFHLMSQHPATLESGEARWNLALWPHDDWVGIEYRHGEQGGWEGDEEGSRLRDEWLESEMAILGTEEASDVIPAFAALCVRVARALHDRGIIRELFGRDVPIIMHDDEEGDEMIEHTAAANPTGLVDDYLDDDHRWLPVV